MKVYKFGGASVKDAAGVKNVASIIQKYGEKI
jgi:aspartate kinase